MHAHWMLIALAAMALLAAGGFSCSEQKPEADPKSPKRKDKVVLNEEEWRKRLTPDQYRILRKAGTEPAFCSPMVDQKKSGVYHCVGCDLPLFKSDSKFKSGTGWPSFFQPADKDAIWTRSDRSFGMVRTEVLCARCDGHLGHVFDDAPQTPTGLRYCINGEVLRFRETRR
jgi:methionine-R-sulfoxide reductase